MPTEMVKNGLCDVLAIVGTHSLAHAISVAETFRNQAVTTLEEARIVILETINTPGRVTTFLQCRWVTKECLNEYLQSKQRGLTQIESIVKNDVIRVVQDYWEIQNLEEENNDLRNKVQLLKTVTAVTVGPLLAGFILLFAFRRFH